MNKTGKEFYKNSIVIRRTMVELIFRNHNGRGFAQEKIDESKEEFGPVNDRVMHFTEEKVKKIVKMSDTMFDDDSDLHFNKIYI